MVCSAVSRALQRDSLAKVIWSPVHPTSDGWCWGQEPEHLHQASPFDLAFLTTCWLLKTRVQRERERGREAGGEGEEEEEEEAHWTEAILSFMTQPWESCSVTPAMSYWSGGYRGSPGSQRGNRDPASRWRKVRSCGMGYIIVRSLEKYNLPYGLTWPFVSSLPFQRHFPLLLATHPTLSILMYFV